MSLSRDVIERLPRVEGTLNYLAPMAEKPMNLAYDPPAGVPRSNGKPEPHRMTVYDARPVAARLSLDGEGLALAKHPSAVKDFYEEDELRRVIIPRPSASRRLPVPTGCWFSTTRSAGAPGAASTAPLGRRASRSRASITITRSNPARDGSAT